MNGVNLLTPLNITNAMPSLQMLKLNGSCIFADKLEALKRYFFHHTNSLITLIDAIRVLTERFKLSMLIA